jgi:hydroxylamine reductase
MGMFCFQCEQTVNGGCTEVGNCGKDSTTAALQDVLLQVAKGLARYGHAARRLGKGDPAIDRALIEALFTTVTNVNFDPARLAMQIRDLAGHRDSARKLYEAACAEKGIAPETFGGAAAFVPAGDVEDLVREGERISIRRRFDTRGKDLVGLEELLTYGIKGMAAYLDHAWVLGHRSEEPTAFLHAALDAIDRGVSGEELFALCMACGQANLKTMELLDEANTGAFGHPVPTQVRVEPRKGKAIVVSGHDLADLKALLEQTAGTGIQVYTHGEMLPAHGYPELKKFPHLAGNYGGAWQDQVREFDAFPGAILMTTNCIQRPKEGYKGRIFTSGLVAFPGVRHIADRNFRPVIEAALEAPGFAEDGGDRTITVGFARNAVLGVAGQVIDAVKSGAIRHFFLVGGCDGAKVGRNYYTELAEKIPQDCVILTLACGKYRFNKLEFGDIGGIPRLLDVGQCNDAYSAIRIAAALAEAFGTDVNGLPLSLILSWYEQKAVAVLLTLLSLGIKNIRIGPSLPAWLTPSTVGVLVEKFGLAPITTPDEDLKAILG